MPDRKPFATSFLPLCSANVPCRTGNFSPIVSCRHAPPMSRAGWETIRKQFPFVMNHIAPKSDRKLFANSFLPPCSTTAPCRTGNYPRTVFCRHAPPLPHAGWETICKQFPTAMLHQCPTPDRKLSASSFLSPCSTTAPRRARNYPPTVSCRYAPPLPHTGWEAIEKRL